MESYIINAPVIAPVRVNYCPICKKPPKVTVSLTNPKKNEFNIYTEVQCPDCRLLADINVWNRIELNR